MSLLDTEVFHHSVTNGIKLFLSKTSHFGVFGFLVVSALGLHVLSLSLISSLPVSAESKQSSLTITTTSSSHNISIMPSPSGTFGKSNSSTISVSTNNYSGYTLSISMPTTSGVSSGSLSDGLGHEITTLGSAVSESAFSGSSGTSYNNKWGYRPSQYVNSTSGSNTVVSNTSFLPAPSSTGTLIDVTSSANASSAKSYTLDVATRISSSLPSGSYAGRLIITAVANNIVYNLNYDKNTTSDVSNMPTPNPQVATISGGTAASESVTTLSSTIPTRTGYNFSGWCSVATTNDAVTGSQTCPGTTYPAGGSYGIDQTSDGSNIRLYAIWTSKTYTINLNGNGATTAGSSTTTATYSSPTLSTITNPSRVYNIGGYTLPSGNKADGATVTYPSSGNCTSSSNCKSTYTFNGWYKESGATNKIASNATTPVLQASTTYTDANGKWTYTTTSPAVTLYAGWTSQAVTLPTITKTGHTCGWTTTSTGATSITYASGGSFTPSGNVTLYGVCTTNSYTITLNANGGSGGSSTTTVSYGATTLGTITNPSRASTTGTRTISGFTMTTSGTNASVTYPSSGCTSATNCKSTNTTTYTFNGWYKETGATNKIATNATTPVLQASTSYTDANGKWTSTSGQTLYAGWTASAGAYSSVTLPTITRTGSTCGWSTSSTATTWTYNSGASVTPTGNMTLYGVCRTDLALNLNDGNTGSTSATVTYGATSLSTITAPTRSNTTGTRTISGLTADGTNASGATVTFSTSGTCTSTTNCKSTNTTTYTFNGWYKESGATNKIAGTGTTPALEASTTYTNSSKQWTYTTAGAVTLYAGWTASAGAYSSITLPTITKTGYTCGWDTNASATNPTYASGASLTPTGNLTLHGICKANTYTITLNANGGSGGSSTTTATYNATTLATITNPSRANTTGTRTVSGFTLPSGNKADNATVTYPSSGCTSATNCKSTNTTTYTFNGWYKESGATNKIASNATTPVLQASTSYTDANGKWTSTSAQTLYAGWSSSAGAYSSVTLPTITKTGHTCGWTTTSTGATSITYASGGSFTPSGNVTLYGVCTTNSYTITLNANGGSGGSSSTTVSYGATTLGTITNPTRASTTGTRTISGFTMTTSGTNASVTYPSSGCTSATNCKSTNTTTYTFNGWYKETGATNKIASNATTPVLQASTSYTDANGKWTSTSGQTLYAGWTASAGAYSSVTLPTITRTGSTCGWATSSTATTWNYNSGASVTPTGNMTLYGVCRNNITLNNAGATTAGSTSATVTYNATSLSSITLPQRKYTVSGFTLTTSGANATVSSTSTLTNTATFNGWYTASSGGTKIAGNTTTPALEASTTYTNSSKQWTYTTAGAITLYSQWTDNAVTLPTITRTGSTCGWSTSSTATTWTYNSGASVTPTSNMTLYGVCRTNLTLNLNGGSTGSTSATVTYGATSLSTITAPTRSNTTGTRTVSGFTLTTNGANATVSSTTTLNSTNTTTYTFNGWYKESGATNKIAGTGTTPALEASTTYTNSSKQWTYTTAGAITLYAGWTASAGSYSSVTLPTITRTGSTCGWSTSSTATTWTYNSGASFTPTANTTLYGVCRTNLTLNLNGGNSGSTSATVNYGATSLSSITAPGHANDTYTVSGFTKTTSATNATVSSTTTLNSTRSYTFNGWYKESAGTNKIAGTGATPALEASTTYTNSSKQWTYTTAGAITLYAKWTAGSFSAVTLPTVTRTGSTCGWSTSSTATSITYASGASFTPSANTTLYAVCVNNLTLNLNGGTGGTTSGIVKYGDTVITNTSGGNLTNPTKANSSASRTVSGFTLTTSGANATVSSTTTLTSTATVTYTFNGWHKDSGTGTKVASNAVKPVLTASNGYTDANGKWNYTTAGALTFYAGWDSSTGSYSSVTLPTITRTGSTCGWSTSSTATTWTYNSGASFTPTANTTLYGVCRNNITLNLNGGNSGSTSATVNYGATSLSTITAPTRANSTGTRTVSGFTKTTSATNATISSTTTLSSTNTTTYTFNGWYKESGATNKIAGTGTTPALEASTTYTNSSKQWTYTTASAVTLYAGWTASAGAYSSVTLPTITRTGSTCGWSTSSTATTITYASGSSLTPTSNLTLYGVCVTNITLNKNGATNSPTTSTTVNYNATSLNSIATLPTRSYTISGFTLPSGNNANGATVSSTSTITSNYTFNGWYKESGATNKIAGSTSAPALEASTTYTNSSKQWTYTTAGAITLYAGWTAQSKTLPTITKDGHTCGWTTTSTGATTITYASGSSLAPTSNLTLYGVCIANKYTLTINFAGTGVSNVQVRTASGTSGTLIGTVSTSGGTVSNLVYGTNYYLYPFFTTAHEFSSWAKTSGAGTLSSTSASNPYYTIGAGNATVTITGKDECAGKICYNANGSNVVGTMGKQTVTDGASATLLASNFSRTGYGFAGWSDKADPTTSGAKFYGPQETITVPTGTSENGLRLYAIWVQSAGSLQADAGTVCKNLTPAPTNGTANLSSVSALTDERDNDTYAIAKLADGNCWMIENLRLESTAKHNSDGALAQGYGTSTTYGNFGGLADAESTGISSTYSANSLYSNDGSNNTINIGTSNYPAYRMPRYNNWNNQATSANRPQNPTTNSATNSTTNAGMYSYGNYYTWHAAIADLTYNETNNQSTTGTSLCPAGWHLPKGGNNQNTANNEFLAFSEALIGAKPANYDSQTYPSYTGTPEGSDASNKLRAYPNNFLYSGSFYASSTLDRGSVGRYWSSTAYVSSYSYYLSLSSSNVYPGTGNNRKSSGQSIRCTLDTTYLQDLTPTTIAEKLPNVGDTIVARDKRDERPYRIGKLADGNYWMLDNLALDPTAVSLADLQGKTNASDTTLNYLKNGGGTTSDQYATASVSSNWNGSYSYSAPLIDANSINTVPSDATSTAGGYKVGVYYNFCAASAGSYCYGNGTSEGTSSGNATEDICPAGWRMPTGGDSGEYQALYSNSNYNTYANYRAALHLPLSGYFRSGSARYQGSDGFFWSSTRNGNNHMYDLYLDTSSVYPAVNSSRYNGYSMRCLLDTTQSSNSPQSVSPNQSSTNSQPVATNSASPDSTSVQPTRSAPLAMSSPTQNATPATSQDDSTNTTEETIDPTDSTDSTDSTTATNPSSTTTSPHGVTTTELSDDNEKQASAVRTSLAIAAATTATAGTILFLLAKRKKDDEDDEDEETNQNTP